MSYLSQHRMRQESHVPRGITRILLTKICCVFTAVTTILSNVRTERICLVCHEDNLLVSCFLFSCDPVNRPWQIPEIKQVKIAKILVKQSCRWMDNDNHNIFKHVKYKRRCWKFLVHMHIYSFSYSRYFPLHFLWLPSPLCFLTCFTLW